MKKNPEVSRILQKIEIESKETADNYTEAQDPQSWFLKKTQEITTIPAQVGEAERPGYQVLHSWKQQ